ncbi:MAG TPA: GAF domain-containing sensor histidine kinase [Vicinamibacterales bacterium]|nr:GAF domain-containing sensor histidine kinase [Vicinamibacterales bacterium]
MAVQEAVGVGVAESSAQLLSPEADQCGLAHDTRVPELDASDPETLRAALSRETAERRRAECLAKTQTDVVKFALDLLVREPDIEGFFKALMKTMAEEGESQAAAVWLIDEDRQRCELWMVHLPGRLLTAESPEWDTVTYPRESMANHLFTHAPGWNQTVEYESEDPRLPDVVRDFNRGKGLGTTVVTPLVLGGHNLGWVTLCSLATPECGWQWWRVALVEAIARQAALALHQSRLTELNRIEERRKAILEERNRLARDIHDNLAQGFAAILMQLQAAQREVCALPPAVARSIETAVDLARTHMTEARRSVGALRPNVSDGEDIARAIKRLAALGQRTTTVPIDVHIDEIPRFGDGVEREILSIAQEALTNALRHARARRITIRASTVNSIGLRLSVADDGRGIPREQSSSGFGMTSMQERADRIGASLTIVTAPRSGTEVVLAWEPSSLPTQVHAVS